MAGRLRGSWIFPLFLAGLIQPNQGEEKQKVDCYNSVEGTIYKYGALTIDGEEYIPFGKYKGKMILFVNVATY
ncbi:unnamed protein product [Eretmochelys imbricata]